MTAKQSESLNTTKFEVLYQPKLITDFQEIPKEDDVAAVTKPLQRHLHPKEIETTRLGWQRRVNYSVAALAEGTARYEATKDDFFRDPNRMLEATISAIVLMATGKTVPKENLIYADLYLKNVKDDYGNNPKNIAEFLKFLDTKKKTAGIEDFKDYKVKPPQDITITKLVKNSELNKSKIPVIIKPCRTRT